MIDYREIYRDKAEAYDRLVGAEDCDGNLPPTLQTIHPLHDAEVCEVGVGTGRLSRLLARGGVKRLVGVEPSEAMLKIAEDHLTALELEIDWHVVRGSGSALPFDDSSVDLCIAGWVFGHLTYWHPRQWLTQVEAVLRELSRACRPRGSLILIETLGVGVTEPAPPDDCLAGYYSYLEQERGFTRETISTDYLFDSPEQAAEACGFFFGAELTARILAERWARVPEWTGVWWRRNS